MKKIGFALSCLILAGFSMSFSQVSPSQEISVKANSFMILEINTL